MIANNLHTRLMLQQYKLQLLTARRLARHRRSQLLASGEETPPPKDPKVQRARVVHQVARELYESLLSTGSDNPMVEDIVKQLGKALGSKVILQYPTPSPLHEEHLRLMREAKDEQRPLIPLDECENREALHILWEIVLRTVDKSTI